MTSACWACRGESLADQEGAQRLALCSEHLMERLREMQRPLPPPVRDQPKPRPAA